MGRVVMGRAAKGWAAKGWAGTGWVRMSWVGTGQAKIGRLRTGRSGTGRSRKKLQRTLLLSTGFQIVIILMEIFSSRMNPHNSEILSAMIFNCIKMAASISVNLTIAYEIRVGYRFIESGLQTSSGGKLKQDLTIG
jgi:hypothetical protein